MLQDGSANVTVLTEQAFSKREWAALHPEGAIMVAYDGALVLAALALIINLVCMWLLRPIHSHAHDRDGDLNLTAAHLHLAGDAAVSGLADYLSEAGLNRARVEVEVEWIILLADRGLFGATALSDAQ